MVTTNENQIQARSVTAMTIDCSLGAFLPPIYERPLVVKRKPTRVGNPLNYFRDFQHNFFSYEERMNRRILIHSLEVSEDFKAKLYKKQQKKLIKKYEEELRSKRVDKIRQVIGLETQSLFSVDIAPLSDEFYESFDKLHDRIADRITDSFGKFADKVRDNWAFITCVFTGIVLVFMSFNRVITHFWKLFLIALKACGKNLPKGVMEFLRSHFSSDIVPQSLSYKDDLFSLLTVLLSMGSLDKFDLKGLLKIAREFKRNNEGIKSFREEISSIIDQVVCCVKYYVFGDDKAYDLEDNTGSIKLWLARVRDLQIKVHRKEITYDTASFEDVLSLQVAGRIKQKYYDGAGKDYDSIKAAIRVGMMELDSIMALFAKQSFDKTKLRPKPLTVLLKGKSGVGKSAMTVPLVDDILLRTFKSKPEVERYMENNMDFIYSRAAEQGFWDGYSGQKAVIYDDFMQANENVVTSSVTNEPFEIIRASNIFPFFLYMSHLEDKGTSYFMGRLLLCSTNNWNLRTETLREPEALHRRFDVVAEVYPKVEYSTDSTANGTLKDRRLKPMKDFTTSVYEIHVTHPTNKVYEYEEFVQLCVDKYSSMDSDNYKFLHTVEGRRKDLANARIDEFDLGHKSETELFHDMEEFEPQSFGGIFSKNNFLRKVNQAVGLDRIATIRFCRANGLDCDLFMRSRRIVDDRVAYIGLEPRDSQNRACWILDTYYLLSSCQKDYTEINGCNIINQYYEISLFFSNSIPAHIQSAYLELQQVVLQNELAKPLFPQSRLTDLFDEVSSELESENTLIQSIRKDYEFLIGKVDAAYSYIKEKFTECVNKYPLLTIMASIASIVSLVYAFSGSKENFAQQSGGEFKNVKTPRVNKRSVKLLRMNMRHQSGEIRNRAQQVFDCVARNNQYVFVDHIGRGATMALAIKDGVFVINTHFREFVARAYKDCPNESFVLTPLISYLNGNSVGSFKVAYSFLRNRNYNQEEVSTDLLFVDFGRSIRPHRNIVNHFINESQLSSFTSHLPIFMGIPRDDNEGRVMQVYATKGNTINVDVKGQGQNLSRLQYFINTQVGDCGSAVYINDDTIQNCLIGFHALGNGTIGAAIFMTRELVEDRLEKLGHLPSQMSTQSSVYDVDYFPIEDEYFCGHELIGEVESPPHLARETKLRRSLLYEWFAPASRAPAVLKPCNGDDPFDTALERYATPAYIPNSSILRTAAISYGSRINSLGYKMKEILSFEEACAGIAGNTYINGIPRKTSAGYPFCLEVRNGKKQFFGEEGDYTFDSVECEKLRRTCDTKEELLLRGEPISAIYMDSLKDELRSLSKVAAKSTRMISCAPLDYVILCRKYFGAFCAFVMENKIYSGCAVGINPFSRDWTNLAEYLGGQDANIIAGDFTGFDCSQNVATLWEICDIINRWYDDGHDQVREALFMDLVNSIHVHGKYLVRFSHCLPSGHPLTTIVNCIYVQIAMRQCWIIHNDRVLCSVDSFDQHIKTVSYGDDNVSGVSDFALEQGFNYKNLISYMKEIGLTYTSENKEEEITFDCKSINECTFLKRSFRIDWEKGVYFAPLDLTVVLEMPYHYRHGPNPAQRQVDNIENCLRELAIHGEEIFSMYAPILMNEAYKHREYLPMSFVLFDYEYYVEKAYEAWMVEESLDSSDDVSADECNVSPPGRDNSLNIEDVVNGLRPQSLTTPAENNENTISNRQEKNGGSAITESFSATHNTVDETRDATRTTHETTGFSQDAAERVAQPFPIKTMDPTVRFDGMDVFSRDSVIQFLKTPVNIRTFTVASTGIANQTLGSIQLPFDSSNNGFGTDSGQGIWSQRLNAYQGFKATAVLKFQVNCNRFAQGRMLIHFIPGQGDVAQELASHRFNLLTKSQTPNVQINLNRDTSTEFRIPYISAWPAYDLARTGSLAMNTTSGQMGVVYAVIYSPLVGTTVLNINVWLHFEDVELFNPTYAPQSLIPQSRNAADMENNRGVVSKPLNTLSRAAKVLGDIPSLSSLAGTASWFLAASARAAQSFGFSKPDSEADLVRVVNQQNAYLVNADGINAAYKFGISCQNKLDILPGFAGNDMDEMSLEYICNRQAFVTNFSWSAASAQGTNLYNTSFSPSSFQFNNTLTGSLTTATTYVPWAFVASYFNMWRADLVLSIKVIKTEFHTGKLILSYRPGSANIPTPAQEVYLAREILDLKESDTFIVKIPYVSLTPWQYYNNSCGIISLSVFNPLNAPASVSSIVDVIIEVSAENVHFAGISNVINTPLFGTSTSWTPQSASYDSAEISEREKVMVVGSMAQSGLALEAARYTNGEVVRSAKQLLNRFVTFDSSNLSSGTYATVIIDPFSLGGCYETGGSTPARTELSGDPLSAFAACYVLMRGSVRLLINSNANNDQRVSVTTDNSIGSTQMMAYSPNTTSYSNAVVPYVKAITAMANCSVSQWALSHSRETAIDYQNTSRNPFFGAPITLMKLNASVGNTFVPRSNLTLSRSVGDDFQLGFFIGVPPMYASRLSITT